ncbi:MAG: bifunctional DNA-formamidopyrimidine glycosylase/DNA-(apurinic or apyrimidinic site) lyase [Betaproteobacteria bacterium]|nr:bifunctional DNA-formamidopyrimidine glycosylase/DNA-(apurinic or apyrimidinic site) lyase [Betaproteobacteria bacterium]
MPELPEVEVCRRGLLPEVEGAVLLGATVRTPRLRLPVPPDLDRRLAGTRVAAVNRRGKYLLFECRGGAGDGTLIIHLGMSGNLRFVPSGTPAQRHDHVDLSFARQVLRFSDPRRFGVVLWQAAGAPEHPLLAVLGIEPLSDAFTGDWLYAATRGRAAPVKPLLMDSHLVVGIGNIYASESLFRAGISPLRAAGRIGRARCEALVPAIRQTLSDAIAAGGSSIRDYVHSDGGAGCFQVDCAVYDRAGLPCVRCAGTVRQVRQGGRSTYWCPACQH